MACEARRELDEMVCRCGMRWDAKDPAPPVCQQDRLPRAVRVTCFGAGGAGGEVALPPSSISPGAQTTNFLFTSGKADPFPLSRADRRYHVVEPPPKSRRASSIAALIPAELTHELAKEMTRAYYKHPGDPVYAMRAAYKVFLDSLHK